MKDRLTGKIISTNLGEFAKKRIVYGYIGIELPDKTHVKIKIDSYTWFETLTLGDEVVVETHTLADTDIIVARKVELKSVADSSTEQASAIA